MKREIYLSVDVEATGPIPGKYSMLSLGACVVGDPADTYYAELKPISREFIPEALKVSGLDMDDLEKTGIPPAIAMADFAKWIEAKAGANRPVFVGLGAPFDWQFINWYFHSFLGRNPFGHGGIDIKAYYMGLTGVPWSETVASKLPDWIKPEAALSHHALADAQAQATIFAKLLARSET